MYQQITLIGNLAADPELRYTQDGDSGDFLQGSDKSPLEDPGWDDAGEDCLVSCFGLATAGRDVRSISDEGATGTGCR